MVLLAGAVAALALVACSDQRAILETQPPAAPAGRGSESQDAASNARRVDPREGGIDIVLGEWAIRPEAGAIRPGRITFVIHNRGTMGHGFEIELEGESSGHGSGDLFKAESRLLQPGESTRMTMNLGPGAYKIECLVDGHDDMGMEGILEVRRGAPLVKAEERSQPGRVSIRDFSFQPAITKISAGTEVSWHNGDPAEHTVTGAEESGFGSDTLSQGDSFSHVFAQPGSYAYRCAIHPDMKGKVEVE